MDRVQRAALVLALVCCSAANSVDNRPRRQFPAAEWVPLTQPCPTCRPLADPTDTTNNVNDIGLVPPRAPLTSRQVHGTGNFFTQNFPPQQFQQRPFQSFPGSFQQFNQQPQQQFNQQPQQQFNQQPQQQQHFPAVQNFFPPQQSSPFLPQTYLNNPQLLLNENPQLLSLVSNPQLLLGQQQQQKSQTPSVNAVPSGEKKDENQLRFKQDQEKSSTKQPQDIRLDQEATPPLTRLQLPLNSPPTQFLQSQQFLQSNQPQQFQQFQQQPPKFQQFQQFPPRPEQQSLLQVNPADPFLTPPPFRNSSDIQIPGLEKEEIQLLYVPVETLRQRGHLQGHQVDDFNLNAPQFFGNSNGHFITQTPAPTPRPQLPLVPPPAVLTQGLPLRDAPQQFATEPPASPPTTEQIITIQPRPVSTVRQQSPTESQRFTARPSTRPSEPTTKQTQGTTFLTNEHLTKVTETLRTEVTAPIPQPTLPPSSQPLQNQPAFQQQQQFQNLRPQSFEQLQTAPEFETLQQLPEIPDFGTLPPRPQLLQAPQQVPRQPERPNFERFQLRQQQQQQQQLTRQPEKPEFDTLQQRQQPLPIRQPERLPLTTRHRFTPTPRPDFTITTEITPPSTTLQPHQPPLSIYLQDDSGKAKIIDVLRSLKDAPTISVIDNIANDNPRVFVGPVNLHSSSGFGKFDLPYLSNLEQNNAQGEINVPFFVAPLNFIPPPGYSKIPFPAPHVGSVVVSNAIDEQVSVSDQRFTTEATTLEQLHSVEPEAPVTSLPETTTTVRTRGRRPTSYRPPVRKPNHSRRVTARPSEEETIPPTAENHLGQQDYLREPQEERRRPTIPSRRQRFRTTTEQVPQTEVPVQAEQSVDSSPARATVSQQEQEPAEIIPPVPTHRLVEPVLPAVDFTPTHAPNEIQPVPQRPRTHVRRPSFPELDFNPPPPPPPAFDFRPPHLTSHDFRQPQVNNFPEVPFNAFQQSQFQQQQQQQPENLQQPQFEQQPGRLQQPQFEQPGRLQSQFEQPPQFQQQRERFQQLPPRQEQQGLFESPVQSKRPQAEEPLVETNGDSGFQQQSIDGNRDVTTAQPISSTQFFENINTLAHNEEISSYSTDSTEKTTTTTSTTTTPAPTTTPVPTTAQQKEPEAEEFEKLLDVTRKPSRVSYPNVPGVKSYPNPGAVKQRSHLRSRTRYTTASTTTTDNSDEVSPVELSSPTAEEATPSTTTEATRTTSRYLSHFNRSRKPLRPTTSTARPEATSPLPSRTSYTVRPLRRSTFRTSVATKRIRKPTTPSPHDDDGEDEDVPEQTYAKKPRPDFAPSAISNEVYDEQSPPALPKPKIRKPYYQHKQKNVEIIDDPPTSPSPSTKTYQERKDEEALDDIKAEHDVEISQPDADTEVNESRGSTTAPSGPSGPTGPSAYEEHEKDAHEERKKARDPEYTKKPRRRLRVRVQKRPHDNFETAESQNHGALSNALIKATPTPDLYHFSQDAEYDYSKFIGTQQKGHVRNITADILESTSTFSSPGTDAQLHHVTIASEPTTILPETSTAEIITVTPAKTMKEHETTTVRHETTTARHEATTLRQETTTIRHETTTDSSETTTSSEEFPSTVMETSSPVPITSLPLSSEEEGEERHTKVVRTSTTTQVSHETEICYKGKCIKTNSDNPEQALKDLVDSVHSAETAKS